MRYEILKYNRIRNLRSEKNLTQKEVALILNIAQNTYSQYETGDRNIPNETLGQIALAFDTSTDYILELTDEKRPYKRAAKYTK